MKILSVRRGDRPGAWSGAALVVLLAALLHLLACAHGPAPAGVPRADTIAATGHAAGSAAARTGPALTPGPTTVAHATTAPPMDGDRDGDGRCRGMDEPTAQPPRDRTGAAIPRDAQSAEPHLAGLAPAPPPVRAAGAPGPPVCPPPSPRQGRARLGVWRT
ncbi:hypothetical protein [Streptomyces sp. NPDC088785]|uniref:hypothetical protein n=1 Tax=Streptomyces sp. NPDC088785 TaxID=3365897 RepID=UPI0037FD2AEA